MVGIGFAIVPFQILLQEQTPEAMTGRVFGTVGSVMTASNIMGPVVGGFAGHLIRCSAGFFVCSGILLTLLGLIYLMKRSGRADLNGSIAAKTMIAGD
ncbi:hypothetical protein [Paenibacillus sp. M2]|uniref:hypothetical protein n=1 Tax=Paenibacillus sp. M2 TaxID=3341793 RepID=UPI003989B68F